MLLGLAMIERGRRGQSTGLTETAGIADVEQAILCSLSKICERLMLWFSAGIHGERPAISEKASRVCEQTRGAVSPRALRYKFSSE
jgi:hypothetical protein